MQDTKIANYIGEAVIILTADHLGIEVEMLDTAKQVWQTKRLPDNPLLGRYATAAANAYNAVIAKGLIECANHLAQVFYTTGEFPKPCEIVRYKDPWRCAERDSLSEQEQLQSGECNGTFVSLPNDKLCATGVEHANSESLGIVEIDYEKIRRVLSWDYNFAQDKALSEKLFIRYFGGVMGRHYYEKWARIYDHDLRLMLAYFGNNLREGQRFCDMIAEQVRKYEQRQSETTDDR